MKISRRHLLMSAAAVSGAKGQRPAGEAEVSSGPGRRFSGEALREIAFPLGGIGTGTVSLGGYGNFRDWEIFNRPNKGACLPFTFLALRLSGKGLSRPLIKVLERQILSPFPGAHGIRRELVQGLPRFREATFIGSYPFAEIQFRDPNVPLEVDLEAFNPMIPLETDDSSLPVAVLKYRLKSRASADLQATITFSIMNPVGYDGVGKPSNRYAPFFGSNLNEFKSEGDLKGLLLSSRKYPRESVRYGSLAVVTDADDYSYRLEWPHGRWWEEYQRWWDDFLAGERLSSRPPKPSEDGATEYATIASHLPLGPGETKQVVWILSWHFPNVENYWARPNEKQGLLLKNHYGTKWESAWEPAAYTLRNLQSLRLRSQQYRDSLYSSTIPAAVIDAVSSQASIIRTNTVMVMENQLVLAFEGCSDNEGCCPMNCTHVYNYEQAMAHLYPDLERNMRNTDFLVNLHGDGAMSFRTVLPLEPGGNYWKAAADGQMGSILKVYREWRLSGDDVWLRKLWPHVKRALEYAWTSWDRDRDGVIEGEQHNTYDIEFYGPNSLVGTLYLGALLAASKMAYHLGEPDSARVYRELFEQGSKRMDQLLWNGEYYVQRIDEAQEKAAKYQYGEGCLSDQLLGQWFAEIVDLGKLVPHEHIRTALRSIFRYNFRQDFHDFANVQRIYALNDEKGLLVCSWPKGNRPKLSFFYSDEVWTGIEYQVAAHLIYEGMIKEGLGIVEAVRTRYDGARRNPWNEVECGGHYARAMSSWSLLSALSGFTYSAPEKEMRFRPVVRRSRFRCLYCAGTAWGSYAQEMTKERTEAELTVAGGMLELSCLKVPFTGARAEVTAPAPATVQASDGEAVVRFTSPLKLAGGERLAISVG